MVGFKVEAVSGDFVEVELFGDTFEVTVVESFIVFFMEDHKTILLSIAGCWLLICYRLFYGARYCGLMQIRT